MLFTALSRRRLSQRPTCGSSATEVEMGMAWKRGGRGRGAAPGTRLGAAPPPCTSCRKGTRLCEGATEAQVSTALRTAAASHVWLPAGSARGVEDEDAEEEEEEVQEEDDAELLLVLLLLLLRVLCAFAPGLEEEEEEEGLCWEAWRCCSRRSISG